GHVARRWALQRRQGARRSLRRRADGPHLREPGGPERQPGSARCRQGHPRDLPPHGDERRRDRRAHRRRPHRRQVPWCRPCRVHRSGTRGLPHRGAGLGLEQHLRHRQGFRRGHQRDRGRMDQRADEVGQRVPGQPVLVRLRAEGDPPRGAGPTEPAKWENGSLANLFSYDYELTASPAGANQWTPKNPEAQGTVPDAHDPSKRHAPMMLTTDLSLKMDPIYAPIAKRFHENPDQLADAFAKAWFKLLHRDMGPVSRYLGPWVPEPQLWQDPVPEVDHDLIDDADIAALKGRLFDSGVSIADLVS